MSTIPDEVAMRALRYATGSTLSMTVFLEFYENGRRDALQQAADEWAADPDAWGDNEKDYRNELRDRAARVGSTA